MKTFTHYLKLLSVVCLMMAAKPFAAQTTCSITSISVQNVGSGFVYFNVNTIGSGSLSPNNYYWDFGDGTTQSGSNLFYVNDSYPSNGSYTVTCIYTDSALACVSTATVNVSITNISCGFANYSVFEDPNGITYFTAIGGVLPGVSYIWHFGDPANTSVTGNSSVTYTASFSYPSNTYYSPVLVVVDSLGGGYTCRDSVANVIWVTNVNNPAACAVNASFTYSLGANGSVSFNNTSSSVVSSTTYTWSYGDGSSINYVNAAYAPVHSYTANGTYTVLLSGSNYDPNTLLSCYKDSAMVITISNAPCLINAGFSASINNNGLVNFYNSTTGAPATTTYTWSFGDGNISYLFSPNHTYTANGTYTVSLLARDYYATMYTNCLDLTTAVITVTSVGSPCTLNADFNSSQGGNGYVNFSNTSTGTSTSTSYVWAFGDGGSSSSPNPSHTYLNGTYSATLIASDAAYSPICVSIQVLTLSVTSNTSCVANAAFALNPSGTPQVWDAYPMFPSNVSAAKWSWGDGFSTDTLLYVSHTYATAGTYFICLTVTITCGDVDSSCTSYAIYRTMHTTQNMNMIQVNVINPNAPLGIKNSSLENAVFNLSPNPNNGSFHININGLNSGNTGVTIYNMLGELVYKTEQETLNGSLVKDIQLNQAANGVYFIKITSKGQTLTKKMVVTTN